MTKRILSLLLALMLLTTGALAYGGGTGEAAYINETELARGFTYTNAVSYSGTKRVETHSLTTEPGSAVYPIVMACDTIYGGFTVEEMTAYAESLGYNVVGAVNADFGESTGVPVGMVVEDGIYKSSSEYTSSAIGFRDGRAFLSERPEINITLSWDGGEYTLEYLNKSRTGTGAYLFSEYFSTVSTRTSGEGWFVRFAMPEDEELTLGCELSLEVTEVTDEGGSVPIGRDNLVLTAAESAGLAGLFESFEPGDEVTLTVECSDGRLEDADWVTGCGDVLASDGVMRDPAGWNSSIAKANPRTALGIRPDGSVVYYVMDGRSGMSAGATLTELAEDMLSMGCDEVVNLDGGGSTCMSLRVPGKDGFTVVNSPSDGKLRAVSSYILFVTDNEPDGRASRLFLAEEGAYILAGSTVELGCAAADRALHNAAVPAEVTMRAGRGSFSGNNYTASGSAGRDTISLSGGGVTGSGSVYVVDKVDSLTLSAGGEEFTDGRLLADAGESVDISVSASYLGREVLMSEDAVSYSVTGGCGSITPEGVFTAAASGAEGAITVECGGIKREISVSVSFEFDDMRGHWANENVKSLYAEGIVGGVSATEFGPSLAMKRGDFVLMLYRAAGEPAVSGAGGFTDVSAGDYYAAAVAWAVEKGVTEGKGEGVFAPNDTLTRQEGFALLYRALGILGVDAPAAGEDTLDAFPDGDAVASWAREAAASLVELGVVEGSGTGLNPAAGLTRAEMAKLLDTALKLK